MTNIKLQQIQEEYSACKQCEDLCNSRSQVVFGSGDPKAKILFLGEAPGATEDKEGIPFCGASGKVLQELLMSIGYNRDQVFITNTIICRPEKNRNPKPQEIKNCNNRLNKTIKAIDPKVIVTVGNFATKTILGQAGITKIRGQLFEQDLSGKIYCVVPVVHPANLLYNGRNPKILEQMKLDFQTILKATKIQEKKKPQASLADF